jgi:GPN-loop GTPase
LGATVLPLTSLVTMTTPPRYGQVVVGPCGSGKTTYCDGMQQYLQLLGRDAVVVNLDPANESFLEPDGSCGCTSNNNNTALPYTPIYDVTTEAVSLSHIMASLGLGPNGGLVYGMEYLEAHVAEIVAAIGSRLWHDRISLSTVLVR